MTVINSAVHFDTDEDYTVELLDVLLNGLPVSLSEEPQEAAETIQIPWNFSSLQLKVLLNESDVFRKNFFRFNIEGSIRNWRVPIQTLWLLTICR